jgi:hypothetical protein
VIIDNQTRLLSEYKIAYNNYKNSGLFNPDEIAYLGKVYSNLIDKSVNNLNDLITIITANQLRMSDAERLKGIDKIHADMQEELLFLRHFNNNNSVLALQRAKEQNEINVMKKLYNTP